MTRLRLVLTCNACPEQYDAYLGDELVGYLRLRHGCFRAECRGETVYSADAIGDGVFADDERTPHLNAACYFIMERLRGELPEPLFTIEAEQPKN